MEGVAVAPDGTLYAAFGRAGSAGTRVFASRDQGATWQSLTGEGWVDDPEAAFRNLVVDPRSNEQQQSLLVAAGNQRTGLYEIKIDWQSNTPVAKWQKVFWYEQRDTAPF